MTRDVALGVVAVLTWGWLLFVVINNGGFPLPSSADGWAWGIMLCIGWASLVSMLFMD